MRRRCCCCCSWLPLPGCVHCLMSMQNRNVSSASSRSTTSADTISALVLYRYCTAITAALSSYCSLSESEPPARPISLQGAATSLSVQLPVCQPNFTQLRTVRFRPSARCAQFTSVVPSFQQTTAPSIARQPVTAALCGCDRQRRCVARVDSVWSSIKLRTSTCRVSCHSHTAPHSTQSPRSQ